MNQVLIDSNIFSYGVKEELAASVAELFSSLENLKYEPAVSAHTTFEVYRGLAHKRIGSMKSLIDLFTPLEVDLTTFKIAAMLTTCYKSHEATKIFFDRYSTGDVVLAASAFHHKMYILTCNVNDFPGPFFKEEKKFTLDNIKDSRTLHVGLMFPNFDIFQKAISENYPKPKS